MTSSFKNIDDISFVHRADRKGWNIHSRGHARFLCETDTDDIIFVETGELRARQVKFLRILLKHGIRCAQHTYSKGFVELTLDTI